MKSSHRRLLGHAGLLSAMTLSSRILGMIRDVICAGLFGTGMIWDAFIYAFTFPNFLRRLFGEGALSGVFVPVYSEVLKKQGKTAAERLANNMFTLLFTAITVLTALVLAVLFFLKSTQYFGERGMLVISILTVLFPYIIFLSLYALAMAILNAEHHFFVPSLGPIIMNAVWISSVVFVAPRVTHSKEGQVMVLAVCLLGAGGLQFFVEVLQLTANGFRFRWTPILKDPHVAKIFHLFVPTALGFAVMQVHILVDRTLAFFVGAGANSSLWYSNRLVQLPMGLFAIAMGTALLPKLSEEAALEKSEEFRRTLSFSLRTVFMLVIPAAAGLIALRVPIISLLFERGAFNEASTARTANTLCAYALGLFAFSGLKIVASGFYAMKDTRTPVYYGAVCVGLNIVLDLILMGPMQETGLALATSISGAINFFMLSFVLYRSKCGLDCKRITITFIKCIMASMVMAFFVSRCFIWLGGVEGRAAKGLFRLAVTMGAGALLYVGTCIALRMPEVGRLFSLIRQQTYGSQAKDS